MLFDLFFVISFLFIIVKYNREHKVQGKMLYLHCALLCWLVMLHSTSLEMLGWAIGNMDAVGNNFYTQIGPIPDWVNLLMWVVNLFFGLFVTILSVGIAQRKNKARKILIKIIPILYVLSAYEVLRGAYLASAEYVETSLILVISVCLAIALVMFLPIYYFYKSKKVKEQIFIY